MLLLLLDHDTVLFVAVFGETVALSVAHVPVSRVKQFLFNDTFSTQIDGSVTVTVQVANLLLSFTAYALIVAVPTAFAVTRPLLSTVATEVLLLSQ